MIIDAACIQVQPCASRVVFCRVQGYILAVSGLFPKSLVFDTCGAGVLNYQLPFAHGQVLQRDWLAGLK